MRPAHVDSIGEELQPLGGEAGQSSTPPWGTPGLPRVPQIIFCTKSYDLIEAAWHMGPCINDNTLLLALCNGLGHEQTLQKIYPKNKTASACIYILSNITSPGHIRKYGGVFLLIAGTKHAETRSFYCQRVLQLTIFDIASCE